MCTKDRNVYIKFVRVSNNLYYYARYLLRLWCSRMWHGGMVSRGRWDMRWWWFSLTDILIHIIHVIHTYVHTLEWGGDTPAAPTLFRVFFGFFIAYTYIYVHIHTYAHIHTHTHIYIYIYIHTCTYISPRPCTLRWGGDTPAAPFTYYLDISYLGEGEIPRLHPLHIFSELCTLRWGGDTPAAPWPCISIPALRQGEWVGLLVIYLMRR